MCSSPSSISSDESDVRSLEKVPFMPQPVRPVPASSKPAVVRNWLFKNRVSSLPVSRCSNASRDRPFGNLTTDRSMRPRDDHSPFSVLKVAGGGSQSDGSRTFIIRDAKSRVAHQRRKKSHPRTPSMECSKCLVTSVRSTTSAEPFSRRSFLKWRLTSVVSCFLLTALVPKPLTESFLLHADVATRSPATDFAMTVLSKPVSTSRVTVPNLSSFKVVYR